jgi:GT2 family glycosyltransferase
VRSAVITLVSGRHQHLELQRRGLLAGNLQPDHCIVVTMNDPAARDVLGSQLPQPEVLDVPCRTGRLPLAKARNLGARRALVAGADLLIFLDVDCVPGPRLVRRYAECASREPRPSLLCGPVTYLPPPPPAGYDLSSLARYGRPHPGRPVPPGDTVQTDGDHTLFWSLSFATSAALWQKLGGFCEQYEGYGGEDTDFGQIAAAHNTSLTWVGGAWAYHQYHPASDPPIQHLDDIVRNANLFHARWGWWPMTGWLYAFQQRGLAQLDQNRRWIARSPA